MGLFLGWQTGPAWRILVAVGFFGGYTTFSSFSLDTYNLILRGHYGPALGNALGSVILGLLGTWLGDVLARAMLGSKV
jgi:CrcB protein